MVTRVQILDKYSFLFYANNFRTSIHFYFMLITLGKGNGYFPGFLTGLSDINTRWGIKWVKNQWHK